MTIGREIFAVENICRRTIAMYKQNNPHSKFSQILATWPAGACTLSVAMIIWQLLFLRYESTHNYSENFQSHSMLTVQTSNALVS